MRIVKDTSIDFMSRTFIASCISALLILVGAVSLITNGGPKLSIDFKGGTLVAVNFTEPVDINKIRSSLSSVSIDGQNFDLRGTGTCQRFRRCPVEKRIVLPDARGLSVGRQHFMPLWKQQESYRYAVTIDGHSGADRLASLIGGNQCILKIGSPNHVLCPDTWASERLFAWEHYLPVSAQMTDLHLRLQWARRHPEVCKTLRDNCARWAATERQRIIQWWVNVTQAMSRIHL